MGLASPKGGVCSAKFWLIAFNKAIEIINTKYIEGNGYADDCSAIAGGARLDHLVGRMERMLKKLAAWGKTCGLSFNADKTVAVLFTRKKKDPGIRVRFEGKLLEYAETVRYLGVTLDSKLHWKEHVLQKVKAAKRSLMGVSALVRRSHGPCPRLMRWAFQGIVRPALAFGAISWAHELNLKCQRQT